MAVKQTAGRDALGEFAPKFAELNDDVLFGQVWSREDRLSLRDRSLVTVVALMAQGLTDESFRYHLLSAKKNRYHPRGDRRDRHPCGLLLRLAQGVGGIPSRQGGLGGGYLRRRCPGRLPARNDLPDRRAEHGLRTVFHRQQLPGPDFARAGLRFQRDLRAALPQPLAHPSGEERRRADARRRSRTGLVSGGGKTRYGRVRAGHGDPHSRPT